VDLVDYLVGGSLKRQRCFEPDRPSRLEIDNNFEFCWNLNRQVSRLRPPACNSVRNGTSNSRLILTISPASGRTVVVGRMMRLSMRRLRVMAEAPARIRAGQGSTETSDETLLR
jgi:hypothetical protein